MSSDNKANALASVRVVVEGLAVAGIIWLANSVSTQNVSIAQLQTQVSQLNSSLADVPRLSREVAVLKATTDEHGRRLDRIEDHHP